MAQKKNNEGASTAAIGFEQQLWKAADILRGNVDASEYKHVVLGLIFLKYISDKFEELHAVLGNEGEGFEEDPDAYAEKRIFFVPPTARWGVLAGAARKPEIGQSIRMHGLKDEIRDGLGAPRFGI